MRNEDLMQKYRKVEDGLEIEEIMIQIEKIREVWQEFHHILRNTVKHFYKQEQIKGIKLIRADNTLYLMVRLHAWDYLIIDLKTKKEIKKRKAQTLFDEMFFIETFNEKQNEKNKYLFLNTGSNLEKFVDFYLQNENVLNDFTHIYYEICLNEIKSYFYFDLIGKTSIFGVYDKTSGLKECYDLEKNQGCFVQLKNIKIPSSLLPKEFSKEKNLNRERKISS